MGVTLERVQNKFACIIGELCSEPVVLSQFAIWLDLRLAEYKAKGAISLDCSGDNPEPSWLNGHRLQIQSKISNRHGARFGVSSPENPQPGEMSWSRISAERSNSQSPSYDAMSEGMVKQEPQEQDGAGVFPVSLHPHDMPEPRTPIRKRTAAETISSEQELLSSVKSRRLTPPHHSSTPTADPTSNQSLMSIISSEMPETQTQETVETVDLTDSDMSIIMSYEDKQAVSTPSRGENSQASYTSQNSMTPVGDISSRTDDSINTAAGNANVTNSGTLETDRTDETSYGSFDFTAVDDHLYPNSYPERLHTQVIRDRIADVHLKTAHSVSNIITAVSTLERWYWNKHDDERKVEEMDPVDLEKYLIEFIPILRRPNGEEYSCHSLTNFRCFLDRFLKENGYPYSISKSAEFAFSQNVLRAKRQWLLATKRN